LSRATSRGIPPSCGARRSRLAPPVGIVPLDPDGNWEPGWQEFVALMVIVYVLWWADTGIF